MSEVIKNGYILNVKPYKESDALISVYMQDESYNTFLYRGFFKKGSKRLKSGLPFHYYQFRYTDKNSLTTPKEIVTLKSHYRLSEDVKINLLAQEVNSIYLKFHPHLNFELYEWTLDNLNSSDNQRLVFCLFLVLCLNQLGLQPYVDGDVNTHSQKINHFDIKAGGFVYKESRNIYEVDELRLIRTLFKAKPTNYSIISTAPISTKIMDILVEYFEYHTTLKLCAYQIYKEIV